ncbi:anti-sigma factor antagonist [Streptomyces kronopolitis]|uniref:Anti-sigma factor antagonist n=1 Tax=Streptomyces kronopolitis TaxID=1612435 RepID=A0ABQ2IVV5_9ACTN|nr:STAS domain-containing protein [Streptomyces kronopolitis]GGN32605.1 anti-sigma factor antagonist [Streptomyces kronopolitis]
MLVPASSVRRTGDCGPWAVVVLAGEVDLCLVPELREVIDALTAEDRAWLVLDLEQVTFMDSSGLGVLVYGIRGAEALGGGLRLAGPGVQVRRLLELTGLDGVVEVYEDVAGACKAPGQ